MPKFSVMFARFPFGATEHPDGVDWLIRTIVKAKADPRIGDVHNFRIDDTPITMGRNKCILHAKQMKADILVMLDNDMAPDLPEPGAKPFWESSLEFLLNHQGPCVVGSPYCGPPPVSNVYIFRWATWQNDNPQPDMRIEQYSREEAAMRAGFEEVAALPTGLVMIDMRALDNIAPPWFYYEWKDKTESEKASTEDVTFTRDLSMAGVPQYVNWDSWSGHWKKIRVDKPKIIYVDNIQKKYVEAVLQNHRSDERVIYQGIDRTPLLGRGADSQAKALQPA